jgi:outer membrane receptor protein involved in Fe transport
MRDQRRATAALTIVIALILTAGVARAQSSTSGEIRGQVEDATSGEPLGGVVVSVTSPALQGSQTTLTKADGRYYFTNLPPGTYIVSFFFGNLKVHRRGVVVPLGQVTLVNQDLDLSQSNEVIVVEGSGSVIDPTSTNQGTRVTQDQLRNIPVPGRTFGAALGAAAGSQGDSAGVAFSGSTSLENQYVIDGVNTTGLNYGTIGTNLINEFIEEIQVITGGYQAEYGRATGAVVNVITKRGSNEFHGTVFATAIPYQVNRTPVRPINSSIEGVRDLDYQVDFGFDLGGPIIKDKVWFYVGFAPELSRTNVSRIVKRQTDCHAVNPDGSLTPCDPELYADGAVDLDPETDDPIYQEVARSAYKTSFVRYQFVSKVNFAAAPEHQGQVSLVGTPYNGEGDFTVTGSPRATRADFGALRSDISAKWTSKFNDNRTEVEAVLGWHRDKYDQDALDDAVLDTPTTRVYFSNLSRFGAAGDESPEVMAGCSDSAGSGDPFPGIVNCPVAQYWLDSPGFIIDNLEDRRSAQLKVSQRVELVGDHIFKGGIDIENNRTSDLRRFTGGRYFQLIPHPAYEQVRVYRYVRPGEGGDVCGFEDIGDMARTCSYLDSSRVDGNTLNWSAFAQDSWQLQPNLTFNYGLRYEEQRLRYAEHLRDTTDPFTSEPLGKNAITLNNMWAPRFGLLYDWTKEGRSKAYASVGRFYESIPMALNDFSFSGDTLYGAFFNFNQCTAGDQPTPDSSGAAPSPYNCPTNIDASTRPNDDIYRGGVTVVAPGTKAQYMDEAILGVEYEILEDFSLGTALKTRRIGRVLDDISVDNAETYIIGNPGEFDQGEERRLEAEIAALPEGDPERIRLENRLEGFRHLRRFDDPRRDYNALELTAVKRFSRSFYLQASYTYARTTGNYPGLLNDDTGAALPNISTQFDLVELLANRDGPLPQDRPHYFKVDGYYTWEFRDQGALTTGLRFRAFSGTPMDYLGAHYLYGFGESYVLPRGTGGRTDFVTNTDIHVGYERELRSGYRLSVFADVINLFNQEQVAITDELYTIDNVNPIVGGDESDLIWAKAQDLSGFETSRPIERNIAYGSPLARYAPLYLQIGARLTF